VVLIITIYFVESNQIWISIWLLFSVIL